VFHSIDLSDATDRFPIDLISQVLEGHLPKGYVSDWKTIMSGFPFETQQDSIYYSVGNPMGAYSSWASFTLAHHYLLYYICFKNNMNWKTSKYVLLGDDIIIGDDELARLYKETLVLIGVDFSEQKTHTSPFLCEFAKR